MNLFPFSSLRKFRLQHSNCDLGQQIQSLHDILSSISSVSFEELSVAHSSSMIPVSVDGLLSSLASLKDIDDILCRSQFARLRDVTFQYAVTIQPEVSFSNAESLQLHDLKLHMEDIIRGKLKQLDLRGILQTNCIVYSN